MGEVGLEIVGLARKLGADPIVTGCRGRRGMRRAVGRGVSDAVIRSAPCPVMVAPSHEGVEGPAILQESR